MNLLIEPPKHFCAGVDATRFSPLIEGAWNGRLVHLSGFDAVGPTAGSLARLVQDRETELWETKRIVSEIDSEKVFWRS